MSIKDELLKESYDEQVDRKWGVSTTISAYGQVNTSVSLNSIGVDSGVGNLTKLLTLRSSNPDLSDDEIRAIEREYFSFSEELEKVIGKEVASLTEIFYDLLHAKILESQIKVDEKFDELMSKHGG